jgi:hypothetical protein
MALEVVFRRPRFKHFQIWMLIEKILSRDRVKLKYTFDVTTFRPPHAAAYTRLYGVNK